MTATQSAFAPLLPPLAGQRVPFMASGKRPVFLITFIVSWLFCFGVTSGACQAIGFKVSGKISVESYSASGQAISLRTRRFDAAFDGVQWNITSKPDSQSFLVPGLSAKWNAANEAAKAETGFSSRDIWYQWGSDGLDTYYLMVLGDYSAPGATRVTRGPVPFNDNKSLITPVWLAYGSSSSFTKKQTRTFKPIWPLEELEELWHTGIEFPAAWQLMDGPPFLPKFLGISSSGTNYSVKRYLAAAEIRQTQAPSPQTSHPMCEYSVTSVTNVFGLELPTHFQMKVFTPLTANSTNGKPVLAYAYSGEGLLFSNLDPRTNFVPEMKNLKPTVLDFRYREIQPPILVRYVASNSSWRPFMDKSLSSQIGRISQLTQERKPSIVIDSKRSQVRVQVVFLISIILILPFVYYFRNNKPKNTQNNEQYKSEI